MKRILSGTAAVLLVCVAMAAADGDGRNKTARGASGRETYNAYCASCHGLSGKGDGPVASALKTPPADLTTIARRAGGRFPAIRVFQSIEGSAMVAAHGSKEMPVWGDVFRQSAGTNEAQVKLRVRNLTSFIESLQTK
jgi:mono/diheme cytochrome c family protein